MLARKLFALGPTFTETSVGLSLKSSNWTALGARHVRKDMYGVRVFANILSNVDVNSVLLLFALNFEPMGFLVGDAHLLRPDRDYPVWRSDLPEGYVILDSVRGQCRYVGAL